MADYSFDVRYTCVLMVVMMVMILKASIIYYKWFNFGYGLYYDRFNFGYSLIHITDLSLEMIIILIIYPCIHSYMCIFYHQYPPISIILYIEVAQVWVMTMPYGVLHVD